MMRARTATLPRRSRRRNAFVLLEVLVSLAILGIALSMVLKQMTTSIKAISQSERVTLATMLGRRLVEEWEINPPEEGFNEGDFEPDHPEFSYEAEYAHEQIDYEDVPTFEEVGRMVYMRNLTVRVYYTPDRLANRDRKLILEFQTALTSSENFTASGRVLNEIDFDR